MRKRNESQPKSFMAEAADMLITVAVALVLATVFRATVAEAYEVPSESMEPAIMTYDRVLAEKVSIRFSQPEQGDVVVIDDPTGGPIPFIKRVIAVAGQTVDVRDGSVWVDGVALDEPYTYGLPSEPDRIALPVRVPDGHIWVMGDNRTRSKDSRYFGPVPVSTVKAHALAVYWPLEHAGDLGAPGN